MQARAFWKSSLISLTYIPLVILSFCLAAWAFVEGRPPGRDPRWIPALGVASSILLERVCKVVLPHILDPAVSSRPPGFRGCGVFNEETSGTSGMPSGHVMITVAAWTGFLGAFSLSRGVSWSLLTKLSGLLLLASGGILHTILMARARVVRRCHTVLQAVVGAILGAIVGCAAIGLSNSK
jgi:membrane-associated phospholipid phosphatase